MLLFFFIGNEWQTSTFFSSSIKSLGRRGCSFRCPTRSIDSLKMGMCFVGVVPPLLLIKKTNRSEVHPDSSISPLKFLRFDYITCRTTYEPHNARGNFTT
ncbi:hypothetical protein Hanom_Chr13g01231681 [Helianthus anomalus]